MAKYLSHVAQELVFDRIDARNADSLVQAARGVLATIRQEKENSKIEELRQMVAEMKEALREVHARVADVRTHRTNPEPAVKRAQKPKPGPD